MYFGFYLFLIFSSYKVRGLYREILNKNKNINAKAVNRFSISFLSAFFILMAMEIPLLYFLVSGAYEGFHYTYPYLIVLFMFAAIYVVYKNYFKILTNEFLSYNEGVVCKGIIVNKIYYYYGMCSIVYKFDLGEKSFKGQSNIGSWFASLNWKENTEIDIIYWMKDPKYSAAFHEQELSSYSLVNKIK